MLQRLFFFFTESFSLAWDALVRSKMRAFLSALGITIGIFCVVTVYALVSSMEKNLNDSFSGYGTDVLFVQKWPWEDFGNNYPWWKYLSRPQASIEEAKFLEKNLSNHSFSSLAFVFRNNTDVDYKESKVEGATILSISFKYNELQKVEVENGRYFSFEECEAGRDMCILGFDIAEKLYGNSVNALGKNLKIKNSNLIVIGVCKKQGKSLVGENSDEIVYIPIHKGKKLFNYRNYESNAQIMIKAQENKALDELNLEINSLMRRYRRLKLTTEATFAINKMSMITNTISQFFSTIKLIGLFIGGFSMLVGCFGVANIMFVSVKERTQEIGISKALGAKNFFILLQFLIESILLCLVGGALGMILTWLLLQIGNLFLAKTGETFILYLSSKDILIGVLASIFTGFIAGFIPSRNASRLNPVDAIRSK